MYVLILGQLINGYAGSVVFSLGIAYIDQSVPAKVAPIYLSKLWILNNTVSGGFMFET